MQMAIPPPPQDTEISGALDTLSQDTSILLTSSANPLTPFLSLPRGWEEA